MTRSERFFKAIGDQWRERAYELAEWAYANLVNRTDVWGRYVAKKYRDSDSGGKNHAITAPFREERGKVFLNVASLAKHFKTQLVSGVLGLHSTSTDLTSRWMAVDIDLHDADDLSITPESNFCAAKAWHQRLVELGMDPILIDSNGRGGFHLVVLFDEPMCTRSVHAFAKNLVKDYARLGLDGAPEVFPGKPQWHSYGDWLRLLGRHHTHDWYSRILCDEEFGEVRWLEGHDAIDRLLATRKTPKRLCEKLGIREKRRTICLDFDGVIHSYRSGWCGVDNIPDPPIHGTARSIERLRQDYYVVVNSARCSSKAGRDAIEAWLIKHSIVVDEVCEHKPPAHVYIDDRAVRFEGDWGEVMHRISDFRK